MISSISLAKVSRVSAYVDRCEWLQHLFWIFSRGGIATGNSNDPLPGKTGARGSMTLGALRRCGAAKANPQAEQRIIKAKRNLLNQQYYFTTKYVEI